MDQQTSNPKKDHLSPSQINMFNRCEAQWFFRYIEGLRKPPGSALLMGSSVDKGAGLNYEQKIESYKDLPVDDVLDAYCTNWDGDKGNVLWHPHEDQDGLREQGIGLLKEYHEERSPLMQPATVQDKIYIPLEGFPYDLLGYIDVTTVHGEVNDIKTSSKSPPKVKDSWNYKPSTRDHFTQLALYSVGYEIKYDKKPSFVTIDYIVKTKVPKVCRAVLDVPDAEITFLQNMVGIMAAKIKAAGTDPMRFMPNRASFLCSQRWCGFHAECMATYGGIVSE